MATLRSVKSDPEENKRGIGIHGNGNGADQRRDSLRVRSTAKLGGPQAKPFAATASLRASDRSP